MTLLRRQRLGQPRLFSADRLLWVWLYRIWPQVLNAMVLVKPATVIDCHRKGFRLYWRRRSRHLGRPRVSRDNVLLFPLATDRQREGPASCRERLGGLLRYYHREAA